MKKRFATRFSKPSANRSAAIEARHNGADVEIHLYAKSLQKAAKSLVQTLAPARSPNAAWDVCPVIWLYRQALKDALLELLDMTADALAANSDQQAEASADDDFGGSDFGPTIH